MSKRIFVAALHHESNSFNPIVTDREDFSLAYGDEIFGRLRPNDSLSGIVYTLLGMGWEVVPGISARAVPNGLISRELYEELKKELLERAREAKKGGIDALTLSLHGSMRIEEIGDAEGDILEALRSIFPGIPILSSLDMHTTMTERMHRYCNGFVGYKCAPHTDCSETGAHAARMTIQTLEYGAQPVSAWCRIPILIAGEKSETSTQPMKRLIEELRQTEKKPGILAASYLMGFPWADHGDHGVAAYVVADGDKELAEAEAARLGRLFWEARSEFKFHTETYPPAEALDTAFEAAASGPAPVYISDSGDNPTAGSSGDCTNFVELIMEDSRTDTLKQPVLYGGIYDPQAVEACRGKVGQTVTLTFGASFDTHTSSPLTRQGTVKAFADSWGDYKCDMALFSADGVDLLLLGQHIGYVSPEMFRAVGAEPAERAPLHNGADAGQLS